MTKDSKPWLARIPEVFDGVAGEVLQPADFNRDTISNQAKFAEVGAQGLGFGAVTAIDRRQRAESCEIHSISCCKKGISCCEFMKA